MEMQFPLGPLGLWVVLQVKHWVNSPSSETKTLDFTSPQMLPSMSLTMKYFQVLMKCCLLCFKCICGILVRKDDDWWKGKANIVELICLVLTRGTHWFWWNVYTEWNLTAQAGEPVSYFLFNCLILYMVFWSTSLPLPWIFAWHWFPQLIICFPFFDATTVQLNDGSKHTALPVLLLCSTALEILCRYFVSLFLVFWWWLGRTKLLLDQKKNSKILGSLFSNRLAVRPRYVNKVWDSDVQISRFLESQKPTFNTANKHVCGVGGVAYFFLILNNFFWSG